MRSGYLLLQVAACLMCLGAVAISPGAFEWATLAVVCAFAIMTAIIEASD